MQYPKTVKLYLSGNWFHAYDDDAKVVSFITNFKLYEDYQRLCPTVGFPYDSLTKVEGLLRENKINYVLLNHTNKFIDYKEENAYEPIVLTHDESVTIDVEKGAWFKIGIAIENPSDVPIASSVIVENVEIRIE